MPFSRRWWITIHPIHVSLKFFFSLLYVKLCPWAFGDAATSVLSIRTVPKNGMQPWIIMPDHKKMFFSFSPTFHLDEKMVKRSFPGNTTWRHVRQSLINLLQYIPFPSTSSLQPELSLAKLFAGLYPEVTFFHFRHASSCCCPLWVSNNCETLKSMAFN